MVRAVGGGGHDQAGRRPGHRSERGARRRATRQGRPECASGGATAVGHPPPPGRVHELHADQIILVGAAIVSLVIQQWATAIVLFVITLFNALVGLRQAGKAESAMNALQSMMKATARVRRDGAEAEIPAEQVVVGDVVLISAGDEVPADG